MAEPLSQGLTFETAASEKREGYVTGRLVEFNRAHAEWWEVNHDGRYEAAPLQVYADGFFQLLR